MPINAVNSTGITTIQRQQLKSKAAKKASQTTDTLSVPGAGQLAKKAATVLTVLAALPKAAAQTSLNSNIDQCLGAGLLDSKHYVPYTDPKDPNTTYVMHSNWLMIQGPLGKAIQSQGESLAPNDVAGSCNWNRGGVAGVVAGVDRGTVWFRSNICDDPEQANSDDCVFAVPYQPAVQKGLEAMRNTYPAGAIATIVVGTFAGVGLVLGGMSLCSA